LILSAARSACYQADFNVRIGQLKGADLSIGYPHDKPFSQGVESCGALMLEEPSVLDYIKSIFAVWKGKPLAIPKGEPHAQDYPPAVIDLTAKGPEEEGGLTGGVQPIPVIAQTEVSSLEAEKSVWPWRSLLALMLALAAQISLEPDPNRSWITGAVLYLLAAIFLVWAILQGELAIAPFPSREEKEEPRGYQSAYLLIGLIFALLAFVLFGGNRFGILNTTIWLLALFFIIRAFWLPGEKREPIYLRAGRFLTSSHWNFSVNKWTLLVVAVFGLALFFRCYRLTEVPPEMISDHAEKLLDVWDVLHGEASVFFPRNTGREAFQMYLTAAVIKLFETGYTFLSLKIGTVVGGLVTLPFLYLLGKEIGNRRLGLWTVLFAGIAYWPNIISRIALRFTLYPLFVAPTLYFFLRGLRKSNRNDFILSGLFLGIGLHGYTPFRVVPILILVGFLIYFLHNRTGKELKKILFYLFVLALIAFIVFLPLLRYAIVNPELFSYRAITRLGTLEQPYPGNPLVIFFKNLWNALTMFAWDNGEVWVISIVHRPVLDIVSSALFHIGVVLILMRYIRNRNWSDIFVLISIPILMLPSILSLAFPAENPSLNRTAGALVAVFLIIGLAFESITNSLSQKIYYPKGAIAATCLGLFLVAISAKQNYAMVFDQYEEVYQASSWNSSEIGEIVRSFSESVGDVNSVFIVGYPYWVDTRVVGFSAGYPTKDFAIWPQDFAATLSIQGPKLFIIKPEDTQAVESLRQLYPNAQLTLYDSAFEGKDFYMFLVPPASDGG
jgi:hypothetical protein